MVLLLLLALWIGSAWWYGGVNLMPTGAAYVGAGELSITWKVPWSIRPQEFGWNVSPTLIPFRWWFTGERYTSATSGTPVVVQIVVGIPLWLFAGAAGAAAGFAWFRDRPPLRATDCPKCHYDRTGLAPGAVCPECGAAAPESV